uniref:Cyclic AMP-responsive element-binding protein 3-like protein 4 n=1 Tax=Mola mola TaxID=94237 RepID=A0A3Q3XDY8_MOLML
MEAESSELFLGGGAADGWQLEAPFPCSDKPLLDWAVEPGCTLNDSEEEDVLQAVDPNEVFPRPPADPSSESDSGISEGPVTTATRQATLRAAPATVYQVVYDLSGLGAVKTEPGQENVISIELDEWSSQVLLSDSCVVSELPVLPAARLDGDPVRLGVGLTLFLLQLYPELQLTEEEQKLLSQEGVSLPGNMPLTKAEERVLKRVRRKIRNKLSAQDSRRRRKEYIDGLEGRAAACSTQNKELQRTVEQLERRNMSLLAQLRQLQSLITQTASKGAQTSTCLLIILVSLGLLILPSFSPFSRSASADDDYRPTGVISRNILTDPSSSSQPTDEADPSPPPSELAPPGPSDGGAAVVLLESTGKLENTTREESQSGNSTAVGGGKSGLQATAVKGRCDPAKPAHADEM